MFLMILDALCFTINEYRFYITHVGTFIIKKSITSMLQSYSKG